MEDTSTDVAGPTFPQLVVTLIGLVSVLWYFWGKTGSKGSSSSDDRIANALKGSSIKDIEAIADECKATGQPWKDPNFGHDEFPGKSIGYTLELRDGERGKLLQVGKGKGAVSWQPPPKFSKTRTPLGMRGDGVPTWLYSDNDGDQIVSAAESMNVTDVAQGSVGDCYFLSALAAAVQHHPDLADDLIDETYEEQGIYGVSFWIRGKWRMVWVDSYFPCYRPSSKSHRNKHRLIFAGAMDQKEIWPLVVEKAFAKLSGSYEAISGGHISKALELLTGGRGHRRPTSNTTSEWNKFKNEVQSDEILVGAGSQQLSMDATAAAKQEQSLNGIITGHAYTDVNVYDDVNLRLVELRNPWGRGEWKGDWGPGSRKWNSEEGRKVADAVQRRSQSGRFWMSFDGFCSCFDSIDTCHIKFSQEDRARRAELAAEAARIIAKKDRPKKKTSNGGGNSNGTQPEYTQESADAMMELLIAEEAKEKRMKQIGSRGNKRSAKKKKN